MKFKLLALAAITALSLPVMAQQIYIGGAVGNGDLETGLAPFTGIASSISTDQARSGVNSMKVDLTANNGEGQWKLLHTNALVDRAVGPSGVVLDVEADVLAGNRFNAEMWVYIPDGTGLGTSPVATVQVNLEAGPSASGPFSAAGSYASTGNVDITGLATDTWHQVSFSDAALPAGTTHVQTRAWFLATVATVNGVSATAAAPSDWTTDGYSGNVYFDDFKVESVLPPDPSIIICDAVRNGDLETGALSPWSIESSAGSIGDIANLDPVHTGSYSLGFNVDIANDGNRWKQFNNISTGVVTNGDRINGQAWVYIPTGTVIDPSRGRFSFQTRSDNGNSAQGRIGQTFVDIRPANHPFDVWVPHTWQHLAVDGANPISSVTTTGWFLETQDNTFANQSAYSGLVYLDDIKLTNIGPATPGVIVDDTTANGDLESPSSAPWTVSGAGSASTAQNHTAGGSQSVCIDLTKNNSLSQWKGLNTGGLEQPIEFYTKADLSMWVYVPMDTTFGGTALINLSIRDGATNIPGAPSLDLTGVTRDTWVEVGVTDYDVSGFSTSLAINNWNLETEILVGGEGSLVRADGTDGTAATGSDTGADLVGPAVPQDWIDAGYDGVVYLDDIYVALHSPVIPDPVITINSITYDGTDAVFNYDTPFDEENFEGVDIYYSTDLVNWTADVFVTAVGNGLEVTRPSGDTARYYIFVQPGQTPNFGNFPAPPIDEG